MSHLVPAPLMHDDNNGSASTSIPGVDQISNYKVVSEQNIVRLTNSGMLLPARTPIFDRVVEQARRIFDCRSSMLTIIDEKNNRQFFKAESGPPLSVPVRTTSLAYSFCKLVVQHSYTLAISDTRADPRIKGHDAIAEFDVVAYLGVPIKDETGQAIAALCLVDPQPRIWTSANIEVLQAFAEGVATQIKSMFWAEKTKAQTPGIEKATRQHSGKIVGASLNYHCRSDGTERIQHASAEAKDIWGISGHEYAEKYADVFGMCLVEDYPLARASFGNSAGGMMPWHHKWRIRTQKGELKFLEGYGLPSPTRGGNILWKCTVNEVPQA